MLTKLRTSVKGWIAYVFLGFIVVSFGFSGLGDFFGSTGSTPVVSAGDLSVTRTEFEFELRSKQENFTSGSGRGPTPEERQAIVDDLVDELQRRVVVQQVSEEIGLDFDESFTGAEFHTRVTGLRNLRERVLSQIVSDALRPPKALKELTSRYGGEMRDIEFIQFFPNPNEGGADPTEAEIQTYYDENKEKYLIKSNRSAILLELSTATLRDKVTVDEAEIEKDFKANPKRLDRPEGRELFQFNFDKKEDAEAAREKLISGTSVDALARELEVDREEYELGTLSKKDVVSEPVAEVAFKLEAEAIGEVVSNGLSYAVVKVGKITPKRITPEEDVKRYLRENAIQRLAFGKINTINDQVDDLVVTGKTFEEIGEEIGIKPLAVETVYADGTTGDSAVRLPGGQAFVDKLFETDVLVENQPFTWTGQGQIWYEVRENREEKQPTLEEVKAKVIEDIRGARIGEALKAKVDMVKQEAEAGKSLKELAPENGGLFNEIEAITRGGFTQFPRESQEELFKVAAGEFTAVEVEASRSYYLVKIKKAYISDQETRESENAADFLKRNLTYRGWQGFYKKLQESYPVSVNDEEIKNILISEDEIGL